MLPFLLRRFANYAVLVAIATCIGYFLAASVLNPRANYEGRNPPPPESSIDAALDAKNLNDKDPVVERFGRWASGVSRGDFGETLTGDSVTAEMLRRIGVSLRLLLIASVLGTVIGVGLGAVCAMKQYSLTDRAAALWAFAVLATPVFLTAVFLKYGASEQYNKVVGEGLKLFYVGETNPSLDAGFWTEFSDRVRHLILPTISLVIGQVAFYSRYQRNAMLDVLGSDFLRSARAKGLTRRRALVRHGLRTALIPMATFFAYNFGLLITGAAFTEKIFGWHGMGEWFVDAISANDVNVVAAVVLFAAVLVLIAGLLADLAYAALDPRVRVH